MGYSHYWKIEHDINLQAFKKLQTVAAMVAEASDAHVELSINTHPLYPSITVEGMRTVSESMSLMASDAHETFHLTPHAVKFEFCKTARKPYDEVVVGILDFAHKRGLLEFTSDGNADDLAVGRRLVEEGPIGGYIDWDLVPDTEVEEGESLPVPEALAEAAMQKHEEAHAEVEAAQARSQKYKRAQADDYVINWPEAGAEAARDVDLDQVSLLLDKIQKITSRPLIITGDSRRDLDNLVALLRWEIGGTTS